MEYELDLENDMAYRLNDSGGVVSKLSGHDFLNLMKQNGGTLYRKGRNGQATGAILSTGANTDIFQALTTPRQAVDGDAVIASTVQGKAASNGTRSRTSSTSSSKSSGRKGSTGSSKSSGSKKEKPLATQIEEGEKPKKKKTMGQRAKDAAGKVGSAVKSVLPGQKKSSPAKGRPATAQKKGDGRTVKWSNK